MHPPPPCATLGPQCQQIPVTLRIGALEEGTESLDHEATWLLGHTAQISFGLPRAEGKYLLVDSQLHVRCRHLKAESAGIARCAAYGYSGAMPPRTGGTVQPRRLGGDRFMVVTSQELGPRELPFPPRSLPVLEDDVNPCSIAPCATADHRRGSACCRDLQVEIVCGSHESALEALVRSR